VTAAHEVLPHTADLRAVVRGPDQHGLYQAAVDLLREVVVGQSLVEVSESRLIELPVDTDASERFFAFVRELVYLNDVDGFLPAAVVSLDPATVTGEPFADGRHEVEHHVKALTRHGYRFERTPDGYEAEMVFDL